MSYLITGSKGFIGSHFCRTLDSRKIPYYSLDAEFEGVLKKDNFSKFNKKNITVLIHFAAKTFVPDSWEYPDEVLKLNVIGTINALEFCKFNKCKMIFISSYMYGVPEYTPIDENHKISTLNPYALSKRISEEICEFYSINYGVNVIIIRPFNVYGPKQHINFLIPFVHDQLINGDIIKVKDLEPKRDYLYIDDLIEALISIVDLDSLFEIINIGFGKSYSVKEVIDISQEILNSNKPITQERVRRNNEVMDVVADISKVKKLTGWLPKVSIREGMEKCLKAIG